MSAGSGAFPVNAGFNQSGGAYYMVLADLEKTAGTAVFVNTIEKAASGSGGAFSNATFKLAPMSTIMALTSADVAKAASLVNTGALLKDMGKTVVSSSRVFRKFAPVVNAGTASTMFGVVGAAPVAPNAGYGSFYLEVGRAGSGVPAPVVRYM